MKVLKATEQQYLELNGFENGVNKLEFAKDANDNWITSIAVKENPAFSEILDKLNELEEIDHSPILEE